MNTREYVVGLPCVVTVGDDGSVRVDVDLTELGVAIADSELLTDDADEDAWIEDRIIAEDAFTAGTITVGGAA